MTNEERIRHAIKQFKGKVEVGCTAAHESDPITYELIEITDNEAVLELNGLIKRFPVEEVFDVNKVKNFCIAGYIVQN